MTAPILVANVEDIRTILREEIQRAGLVPQTASRWKWLGPTKGPRQFGISQESWKALLDSGKLPSTARPCRGGATTRFVRESDAVRYFTPRASA